MSTTRITHLSLPLICLVRAHELAVQSVLEREFGSPALEPPSRGSGAAAASGGRLTCTAWDQNTAVNRTEEVTRTEFGPSRPPFIQ